MRENHAIEVTRDNPALGNLTLFWRTAEYSAEDSLVAAAFPHGRSERMANKTVSLLGT